MKFTFVCLNCAHEFSELVTETRHPRTLGCPECGSKFVERVVSDWSVIQNQSEDVTCGSRTFCEECGLCEFSKRKPESESKIKTIQASGFSASNQPNKRPVVKIPVEKGAPVPPMYEPFTMPQKKSKKITIPIKKAEKKRKK